MKEPLILPRTVRKASGEKVSSEQALKDVQELARPKTK